ncbi:phage head closure protein [Achromobacter marplatensis]|uniref:phage head closure protein n=1 Tax=Achromobacter marplatensis TaxID=470868 RepID=UPI000277E0BA|nr:phage head closure protein [Achromobacter marplatensis]EJO28167.1 phage head-tail adaptor [Achromobacter marplatensis]
MLRAGSLNRRVVIERPEVLRNPSGQGRVVGWERVATVWANIRVANGKEHIASGAEMSPLQASFRIRWLKGITTEMRLTYAGIAYEIEAVLPDLAGHEYVDLVATAGKRKA